jgi:hypothetical protein
MPVRYLDLKPDFNAAQMGVHGAAQVAQAGVVVRAKGVSDNQADNPMK